MNSEDNLWDELKDDWTGRIYKSLSSTPIVVEEDLGSDVIYRLDLGGGTFTHTHTIKKSTLKSDIIEGLLVRVK